MAGIEVTGPMHERFDEVLTPSALALIERLHRELNPRRLELLRRRAERSAAIAAGADLDFLAETKDIREDDSCGSRRRRRAWRTAGSRSPAPPTAR